MSINQRNKYKLGYLEKNKSKFIPYKIACSGNGRESVALNLDIPDKREGNTTDKRKRL